MGRIRLRDDQTRAKHLPEVCMVCGERSSTHLRKNFSWFPPWVGVTILAGLLPYVILVAILTKRMVVEVPVCDRHRGHFWKRTVLILLAVFVWLGGSALAFFLAMALTDQRRGPDGAPMMVACLTFVLLLIGAVVAIAIIQNTAVRPKEITDDDITLIHVSDGFIDAFDEQREARRARRYAADDIDEPPPRRAADDDRRPPQRGEGYRATRPEDQPRRRRDDDD